MAASRRAERLAGIAAWALPLALYVRTTAPTVYGGTSHFRLVSDTLRLCGVFLRNWRQILVGPDIKVS